MARIRSIKPEFWQDEKLAPLAPIDRLVFLGLICQADDAGRLVDNVRLVDGLLFPQTDDSSRESLENLWRLGRIVRYRSSSGQNLIQVARWAEHQRVDHPSSYTLPGPGESGAEVIAPPRDTESSRDPREILANPSRESRESLARSSRPDLGSTISDQRSKTHDLDLDVNGNSAREDQSVEHENGKGEYDPLLHDPLLVGPPPEVMQAAGALFQEYRERPELAGRTLSVPKEPTVAYREILEFLLPHYPPTSPGAGMNPCIRIWLARIGETRMIAAIREMKAGRYQETKDAPVKTWGQLDNDWRKRVIQEAFNGMLKARTGS